MERRYNVKTSTGEFIITGANPEQVVRRIFYYENIGIYIDKVYDPCVSYEKNNNGNKIVAFQNKPSIVNGKFQYVINLFYKETGNFKLEEFSYGIDKEEAEINFLYFYFNHYIRDHKNYIIEEV